MAYKKKHAEEEEEQAEKTSAPPAEQPKESEPQESKLAIPPLGAPGHVVKPFTVRLRYTGENPLRAVEGPLPSGAKYQIKKGLLTAYAADVQTLLDRGDFEEIDSQ